MIEQTVPNYVLKALEDVRKEGKFNMFASQSVLMELNKQGRYKTVEWLIDMDHLDRNNQVDIKKYQQALNELKFLNGEMFKFDTIEDLKKFFISNPDKLHKKIGFHIKNENLRDMFFEEKGNMHSKDTEYILWRNEEGMYLELEFLEIGNQIVIVDIKIL